VVERGTPPAGLAAIYSPPPILQQSVDWLNVFYAVEWAVFAGFAIYLWYRVAKDAWEREIEDAEVAAGILPPDAVGAAAGNPPEDEKVD
jgi:surfeit locus 1 family protein